MKKEAIQQVLNEWIEGTDIFVVETSVKLGNKIRVSLDRPGGISINECARANRKMHERLNLEDYTVEVSSPGLTEPFKVPEQYIKNQGKRVRVTSRDGKTKSGILIDVGPGGFSLEDKKKKQDGPKVYHFTFDEVKSTTIVINI